MVLSQSHQRFVLRHRPPREVGHDRQSSENVFFHLVGRHDVNRTVAITKCSGGTTTLTTQGRADPEPQTRKTVACFVTVLLLGTPYRSFVPSGYLTQNLAEGRHSPWEMIIGRWGLLAMRPWLTPRNMLLPHLCYHATFSHSRSNRICQKILTHHVPPFKVTGTDTDQSADLLLFRSNYIYSPISYSFRDKWRYLLFSPSPCI